MNVSSTKSHGEDELIAIANKLCYFKFKLTN